MGTAISPRKPHSCSKIYNQEYVEKLLTPTKLIVAPYFLRSPSPPFDIFTCTLETTSINTQTSFSVAEVYFHTVSYQPVSEIL